MGSGEGKRQERRCGGVYCAGLGPQIPWQPANQPTAHLLALLAARLGHYRRLRLRGAGGHRLGRLAALPQRLGEGLCAGGGLLALGLPLRGSAGSATCRAGLLLTLGLLLLAGLWGGQAADALRQAGADLGRHVAARLHLLAGFFSLGRRLAAAHALLAGCILRALDLGFDGVTDSLEEAFGGGGGLAGGGGGAGGQGAWGGGGRGRRR